MEIITGLLIIWLIDTMVNMKTENDAWNTRKKRHEEFIETMKEVDLTRL